MNQRSTFDVSKRIERRLCAPCWLAFRTWQPGICALVAVGLLLGSTVLCSGRQPAQESPHLPEPSQPMVDPGILPLAELTTNVALPEERDEYGELLPMPVDYAGAFFAEPLKEPRAWIDYSSWPDEVGYGPALNFAYRPLYFEQINAERYGRTFGHLIQPCVSTLHFYASAAMLPYKMATQPPFRRVYHDHHHRPGSRPLGR